MASFAEWRRQRNAQPEKKEETTSTGGTLSFAEWRQQRADAERQEAAKAQAEQALRLAAYGLATGRNPTGAPLSERETAEGYLGWYDRLGNVARDAEAAQGKGWQAPEDYASTWGGVKQSADELAGEAGKYKTWLAGKAGTEGMSPEDLYNAITGIEGGQRWLGNLGQSIDRQGEYYGQFGSAEEMADYEKYVNLPSQPDYAEKSQFRSRENGKPVRYAISTMPGIMSETGYDSDADLIYNAVNGDENARRILRSQDVTSTGSVPIGFSHEGWYDLPESVVQNFNYLYETSGPDTALRYLDLTADKGYTPSEAFAWGAMQGSGTASLAVAAGAVIAPDKSRQAYEDLTRAMGRAQQAQPLAYGAGSTTATLAQMAAIGSAAGGAAAKIAGGKSIAVKIGGTVLNITPYIANAASGAIAMASSALINNAGAVTTGAISPLDYVKRAGIGAAAGIASSLASGLTGTGLAAFLKNKGLMTPFAEFVRLATSGMAGGLAYTGTNYALSEEKPGNEEIASQLVLSFAFSMLHGLSGALQSTAAAKAALEQDIAAAETSLRHLSTQHVDDTPEAIQRRADTLTNEVQRIRNNLNSAYFAGQQDTVNTMNDALDAIDAAIAQAVQASAPLPLELPTGAAGADGVTVVPTNDPSTELMIRTAVEQGFTALDAAPLASPSAIVPMAAAAAASSPYLPTPTFPYAEEPYGADIVRQAAEAMYSEEEPVTAESLKGPDFSGWDRIINEERVSGMSESEQAAVRNVFEGEKEPPAPAEPTTPPAEQLAESAKKSGFGAQGVEAIGQFYESGASVGEYFGGFAAYYNAGRAGAEIGSVSTTYGDALTDVQKQAAWNAGRMDAMTENAEVAPYEEVKTPTKQENKPKGGNYFVPGEKNGLPYDIVVEKIPVEEPAAPAYNEGEKPARSEQGEDSQKPHETLAASLREKLENGEAITKEELAALAEKAFGGTRSEGAYDIKTAYDALELAVNQYLLKSDILARGNKPLSASARMMVKRLQALLDDLPTQTVRTEEQQQFQQFSTPPNIAALAAWAANITPSDVVLEPSAGIGGLAVFPKAWGATVYGNELSPRRAEILRSLGLDEVFTENAEQINNVLPDYVQPSVVLMNPPFSSTAGRTATNSTANAKRHIEQALARLNDGGRLVAILGRGMANDSKTFAPWWNELRKKYSIRANLSINGENYKKYGTSFDVQLVVIDKTGPQQGETVTGEFRDLTDIPSVLEGIRNDRVRNEGSTVQPVRGSSERGNQPTAGSGSRGNQSGRLNGGAERADGGAARNDGAAVPAGSRNGGRGELGGTGSQVQSAGRSGNGSEESRNAGASAAESVSERNDRSESELPVQGLSQEAPKAPRKSGTKAAKSDDGVYSEYQPPKTPVKGAKKHPAVLVESAAMGAVDAPPATYKPDLPKELIESGGLSDAQITNVVYAGQAHSQMIPQQKIRKGYFIGDGTGVGKGRQIGGIILDNFRQGRTKALWISKGQNLFPDAQRDWSDIGGSAADVFSLSKIKADNAIPAERGILFTTYDTLASTSKGSGKSRLDQIVDWLGKDFDGVIAFDEAHNMGNLLGKKGKFGASKPAQKAIAGAELQKRLPNARVVYVSATMATDVNEMAFAERLGLWGPGTQFNDVRDFVSKISDGGIAAMELVARDMKAMGVYQARSISYKGVQYDTLEHKITPVQKDIYDTMSRAWQVTLQNMNQALDMTGGNMNGQARAAAKSAYYGAMQRFYNQVLTSMAVPSVIKSIKKDLAAGKSVVIQIVNTNEAETNRQLAAAKESGSSLDDLDITPREALISFLRNSFPVQVYEEYTDENGNQRTRPVFDSQGNPVIDREAVAMRDRMIEEIQSMRVPEGPLEMIFDAFGVEQVAEVTGRKRRVVTKTDDNGNRVKVEERRSDKSNEADVQAFQDGEKRILIFSDAGGTGKSYHADRRAKNQQQRVHYLLQPGWSAPKAVQGFGRTHRSNEVSAPIYKLVTTDVRGQKRFVSTIARRLDQLGALTKGQRQTGSGMFSEKDNLESELALDSLWNFYKALGENRLVDLDGREILEKLGLADKFYDENGAFRMSDTAGRDMATFLNRILALEYDEQNAVFDAFSRIFDDAYDTALANGTLDMGMETIKADKIEILDDTVIRTDEATGATTNYVQAKISQKTKIIPSIDALRRYRGDFIGLYRRKDGHVVGVFRTADKTETSGNVVKQYLLQTPVEGRASKFVEKTMEKETTAIPEKEWKTAWAEEIKQAPEYNEYMRHMLTGTLLPIWKRLPTGGSVRVQRLIADDGRQYLGRVIQPGQIDGVLKSLGAKGRTKQSYTAADVVTQVFGKGKKAVLEDDHVVLTRRRVGNEWRIEITGDNPYFLARTIPGVYDEYINYQRRFFIRNGEQQEQTVAEILKNNPVRDIEDAKSTGDDGVQYSIDFASDIYNKEYDFTQPMTTDEFRKLIEKENDPARYFPKGLSPEFLKSITRKSIFTRPKLYRGIEAAEFDFLSENGFLKSNSSYNFANQQGQTLADEDAGYALSYATGFAPKDIADKHYKDGLPTYLIEFINAPDLNVGKNKVQESYTYGEIDQKYITRVFQIEYDPETKKDMIQDVTDDAYTRAVLPHLGEGLSGLSHGLPQFYRDKTTGTILYAVQGADGYENGLYVSEKFPDVTFRYSQLGKEFKPEAAQQFFGVSGDEADLEPMTIGPDGYLVPKGNAKILHSRDGGVTPHPDEWTARRVGDSNKKPMSTAEIVEKIRHDFGINVTTGHVRGQGVRGQYNPQDQGIRTRIENDLPTLSHELGHHLDNMYDLVKTASATAKKELTDNLSDEAKAKYSKSQLPGEGLAEFVRRFLQNRETAAIDYPEFTAHFLNSLSGPDQARIEVLADEINAYYSLDADTAQSSIVRRADKLPDARTWTEKVKDKAGVFYQAFVDSNYGIKRFDEATGSNAYKLATISAYADNRAGAALVGDLYDAEGAYVCPGLKSCFAGYENYLSDSRLYADLNEYLVVKHGPERLAEGKRVFADDRKNSTAWMNRRQMELERQHPEIEEISDRLYQFQRAFLETWGVNTGLVTRKAFDEWGERWEYYVPFNRAVSMEHRGIGARRGFANQNSTIKKAVGSGKQILSPVDNIIHNMVLMVNAGLRNNVMRRIRNGALSSGDATFMEKVQMTSAKQFDLTGIKKELSESVGEALLQGMIDQTGADVFDLIIDRISDVMTQFGRGKAHGNIVTVMVNGKPEFWKINDPQLLESITSISPKKMGAVMEAYATVSRFMTGNITGNNLLWSIFSNFPRDLMTLFTYAPVKNPLKVFSAMGSAYLNKMRGDHADAIYKEYLAMGGGQGESAYTADRNLEKRIIEKMHKKGISANPLDWISWASDLIEMGPRFATYKLLREAGMSPEEAFYGAQDVTVNFRRGGRIARELNKVIPFFNAGVQGLDKFGRWITANDVPRADRAKVRRGRMIGFLTASAVLAALFYALNNRDDKSKKEYQQLSNYTKNSYWNIPLGDGKYFAIPKPRELAVLSSFFETCMERFGGNEHAYDEFYEYATDTILPNVAAELSQGDFAGAIGSLGIIGVGADLMANRDFLGRPIVSSGLQNLEPKDQYTSRTSMIARAIGEAFNVSPQKVDFFFSQVLGGWWKAQKALFPVGGEEMDLTMGIQNSYIKDNQYSTDLINRLYDYAASSQAAKNSAPDNADKALRAKLDSNMTTFYSRYYALARENGSSTAERGTRQEVLDMIAEYTKAREHGYETKTEKDVYRIAKESGEVGTYLPSVMPVTVKDGKEREHSLSDVQYVQYQLDYNTAYWQTIEAALPRAKNDTERAAIIKAAKQAAKDRATERLLRRLGAPLTGYNDKYEGVTDTQITVFRGLLDVANDDGSLKQEEVIDILDRMQDQMRLSDEAASALFHTRYDSDKNNPYK